MQNIKLTALLLASLWIPLPTHGASYWTFVNSGASVAGGAGSLSRAEELQIEGQIGSSPQNAFAGTGRTEVSSFSPGSKSVQFTGLTMSNTANGVHLVTPAVEVPVGTPVTLAVRMAGLVRVRTTNATPYLEPMPIVRQVADVASVRSLRFPIGHAVFELPEGFSVSSPEGSITDNVYVPPLEVARMDGTLLLSWQTDPGANLVLQSTPDLSPPIRWSAEANITQSGTTNSAVIQPSLPLGFYRLSFEKTL